MQCNSFIYVFKFIQLLFVAIITMSVFFRTTLHHRAVDNGGIYLGELYISMVILLFNGFTEVSMLVAKLPVIYKHRDLHLYSSWIYTLPWILSIPRWQLHTTVLDLIQILSGTLYMHDSPHKSNPQIIKGCFFINLHVLKAISAIFLPPPFA